MLEKLYNSANCPKDKLVISGLGHAQCAKYGGEIYWNKIKDFISKYKG